VLAPIFECAYIADTYACLVGRGTLAAVRRYEAFLRRQRGRGYVLKADIRQYFPSVDQAVLRVLLRRKIGDEHLLRLLDGLIASGDEGGGKGMPIGNLTSQLFANLYLDPLDHFVKETLRRRFYLRYMDDFVILGDERAELWAALREVERFLHERLHLSLRPERTSVRPVAAGVDFLGYVVYPNGCKRVRRRNVVNVRRRLARLEAGHARGEVSLSHARQSIASWLGLAKHARAFRLSRSLFLAHDVRNIGKRLLLRMVSGETERAARSYPTLRHTRSRVSGISVTSTLSGRSASATALAMAAEAGGVPPSPAPLTPSGFRGEGVTTRWTS
jgi:hypothetical protein